MNRITARQSVRDQGPAQCVLVAVLLLALAACGEGESPKQPVGPLGEPIRASERQDFVGSYEQREQTGTAVLTLAEDGSVTFVAEDKSTGELLVTKAKGEWVHRYSGEPAHMRLTVSASPDPSEVGTTMELEAFLHEEGVVLRKRESGLLMEGGSEWRRQPAAGDH